MSKHKIGKIFRTKVWDLYEGAENKIGNCLCCNDKLTYENFHCGHIMSHKNGGEISLKNLRPICQHCNLSMGEINMMDFIKNNNLKIVNNFYGYIRNDIIKKIKIKITHIIEEFDETDILMNRNETINYEYKYQDIDDIKIDDIKIDNLVTYDNFFDDKTKFYSSQIKFCKLNNDIIDVVNYFKLLKIIYDKCDTDDIVNNTLLNVKQNKYIIKGFYFVTEKNISIQRVDSYHTLKEIINICDHKKISIIITIQLKDLNIISYKNLHILT